LANYLCHVTEEFFRNTTVRCRLDVDESLPALALNSEVRHNLYLCVREAMNNVGKHSQASEMWLRIHWQEPVLHIAVEDNGRGFSEANGSAVGDGLLNMRDRLEKIGGAFTCETKPAFGTICRISLPLMAVKI
jgi:signal transduction histidine kinase